ncbi:hypothetical protein A2331_03615 [Candidatus Falkowbacteria bacterium RIFOXYB2_FULL_34_18]|uniref:Lipoprotein n=1 Tax=Candidatus Falkowbacteria bacterium RIFOXYD2_FULL_34_120 TaxID=1798007 RepID=A0A1F5TS86_9BACT|nr:MAG: hypothetical protein A2331_03615 [Candidatus Falkowbacteria bacterium RIFOXYB2_FULL_34_18]OGF30091.1 MAG: hypothetical protein A2500_04835 [Candidatus Falkowbacteria bacterium RIFOXYC12_FULL_34_55]OGF37575.1 MAG: hypothetical protein A2466_02010 [Candidatus Falkowbacteria bacterium RIFOXYC2_FULL_34_220]OGF39331.1 MAG: hypothetical protein A2515_02425 [Candidatus Falkowbacteria bacterium RIFOXYD12_FULL_34_57]OGF41836.1 MAG: hypothetical protein A2531_05410 [Candidatus Falkowbacteria bact
MKKYQIFSLSFLLLFCLCSCGTLEEEAKKIFKETYGMNEYEADTGAAQVILKDKARKDSNGKMIIEIDENGNSGYAINYEAFSVEEKLKQINDLLETTNTLLDPRQTNPSSEIGKYLKNHPEIKKRIEYQKTILEENASRYTRICQYIAWCKMIGINVEQMENFKKWKNDNVVLYPGTDLEKETNFIPEYVKRALENKRAKTLEEAIIEKTWMEEVDNPDYPDKDKIHKKIWETKKVKLIITITDIDSDKKGDYLHIFRLDPDGKAEKYPIISIYHKIDSDNMSILSIDLDRPGDPSFGIPDEFSVVYISSIEDFQKNQQETLKKAINGRKEEKKFTYNEQKMKAYFAQPGKIEIAQEEVNEKGWDKPIDYQHGDFEIFVKYKKREHAKDESIAQNHDHDKKNNLQVEYMALRYHKKDNKYGDIKGRVVEFYRLNEEYQKLSFDNIVINGKVLELFIVNEASRRMIFEYLIEKKSFRIDYDEGEKRISIIDKNNDGILETRKMQTKPHSVEINYDVKQKEESSNYSRYGGMDKTH